MRTVNVGCLKLFIVVIDASALPEAEITCCLQLKQLAGLRKRFS